MKLRLDPHRTLGKKDWKPQPWQVAIDEREPAPMEGYVEDFDHALGFEFRYAFEIDKAAIFGSAGLPDDAVVAAYAIADCPQGAVRLSSTTHLTDEPVQYVQIRVEPGTLAGGVELQRGLVLLKSGTSAGTSTAAYRQGSRLLTGEAETCRLEGSWSRFPLEAAHFERAGLPDVPWLLRLNYDDLEDSFLGSARLLVNADHPAGLAVIEAKSDSLLRSSLRVDLVRQLLTQFAADVADPPRRFADDSVGGVIASIASDILRSDLVTICRLIREEPIEFEKLLHDQLEYLWEEGR